MAITTKLSQKSILPVWKIIKLGTFKYTKTIQKALKTNGHPIDNSLGSYAKEIMETNAFTLSKKKTIVNLVKISVADLGFPHGATLEEIYDRARQIGLDLCPAEVGPQLRLQYKDHTKGEFLHVGMETIFDPDWGMKHVFYMGHNNDDLWLETDSANHWKKWHPDTIWVFVAHK